MHQQLPAAALPPLAIYAPLGVRFTTLHTIAGLSPPMHAAMWPQSAQTAVAADLRWFNLSPSWTFPYFPAHSPPPSSSVFLVPVVPFVTLSSNLGLFVVPFVSLSPNLGAFPCALSPHMCSSLFPLCLVSLFLVSLLPLQLFHTSACLSSTIHVLKQPFGPSALLPTSPTILQTLTGPSPCSHALHIPPSSTAAAATHPWR